MACRNARPGLVQRRRTPTPADWRSTRFWKPRSLTSKPGEANAAPTLQFHRPEILFKYTSPIVPDSVVRVGSYAKLDASGRWKYRFELRCAFLIDAGSPVIYEPPMLAAKLYPFLLHRWNRSSPPSYAAVRSSSSAPISISRCTALPMRPNVVLPPRNSRFTRPAK